MVRNGNRHIEGGGSGGSGSGGAPAQAQAQYGDCCRARRPTSRACSRCGATRSSPTSATAWATCRSSSRRPSGARARRRAHEGPARPRRAPSRDRRPAEARFGPLALAQQPACGAVELRHADLRDEIGWLARADVLFVNNFDGVFGHRAAGGAVSGARTLDAHVAALVARLGAGARAPRRCTTSRPSSARASPTPTRSARAHGSTRRTTRASTRTPSTGSRRPPSRGRTATARRRRGARVHAPSRSARRSRSFLCARAAALARRADRGARRRRLRRRQVRLLREPRGAVCAAAAAAREARARNLAARRRPAGAPRPLSCVFSPRLRARVLSACRAPRTSPGAPYTTAHSLRETNARARAVARARYALRHLALGLAVGDRGVDRGELRARATRPARRRARGARRARPERRGRVARERRLERRSYSHGATSSTLREKEEMRGEGRGGSASPRTAPAAGPRADRDEPLVDAAREPRAQLRRAARAAAARAHGAPPTKRMSV